MERWCSRVWSLPFAVCNIEELIIVHTEFLFAVGAVRWFCACIRLWIDLASCCVLWHFDGLSSVVNICELVNVCCFCSWGPKDRERAKSVRAELEFCLPCRVIEAAFEYLRWFLQREMLDFNHSPCVLLLTFTFLCVSSLPRPWMPGNKECLQTKN